MVTEMTLLKHGLQFSIVMTRDDAPAKPDPTALHSITKKWGLKNHEVLFVGDYLYDLQAGLAAQVPTALFLSNPPDFDTKGATFCFSSFTELEQNFLEASDLLK
jgi:phosphoglycolate phosphatase-like HAD superfamily hydrolase